MLAASPLGHRRSIGATFPLSPHGPFMLSAFLWAVCAAGRGRWIACGAISVAWLAASTLRGDALDRLALHKLAAVHEQIEALAQQRQTVSLDQGRRDLRAVLHVHSKLSHDSRSELDEVLAGAKAAGVGAILFTEHPAPHYDFVRDGHQGEHDGIVCIGGAEAAGFLAWPTHSLGPAPTTPPQVFADAVRREGGRIFLSHLEERMNWTIEGLTGCEIYNTHADFKDESRLQQTLRSPVGLLSLIPAFEQFPQEAFGALQDHPTDYLRRFDELCAMTPHTGIAANDSHHNMGLNATLLEGGTIQIADRLGTPLVKVETRGNPLLATLVAGKQAGDRIFALDLDPYERSFRHVSTHLLVNEVSQASIWDALEGGRAFVAFDWMADSTGFAFVADGAEGPADRANSPQPGPSGQAHAAAADDHPRLMGSQVDCRDAVTLRVAAPLPAELKLLRNGQLVHTLQGRELVLRTTTPGIYRVEAWLMLAGEPRPWILSNPIYLRQPE